MKKILFSTSVLLSSVINSQTLTQANHSFINGDAYSTVSCNTVGITPGATGANQSWNFTAATPNSTTSTVYLASAYAGTLYPNADVAVSSATNNTSYFKSTAADMKFYGGDLLLNGASVNLNYTLPAIYAKYPMSLNTTTNVTISGNGSVLGNSVTFTGLCNVVANGTGTITLPSGNTYPNVVKVTTSQSITTSALPFVGPATITLVYTDFYSASGVIKASLFSIQSSTLITVQTSEQSFINSYNDLGVSVKENTAKTIDLSVYPNPATTMVNFLTTSVDATTVNVFDITGKLVATEVLENGKAVLNTTTLNSGIYIYNVSGKNNQTLKSGKFTVDK